MTRSLLTPAFSRRGAKPSDPIPRFWGRVLRINETSDGCWLWQGATGSHGYGMIYAYGRPVLTHRLSWELHCGPVPSEMLVLHHCDVRRCVRPDHLFLGTDADNHADAELKGRIPRGENHKNSKLTDLQVRKIRELSALGSTRASLARAFRVAPTTIGKIATGKSRRI